MVWKRQNPVISEPPVEPSLVLWLIAGITALVTGMLLFVLHASQLLGPWHSIP